MSNKFTSTFKHKLIYVLRINDEVHSGLLKIGDATLHTSIPIEELVNSCRELNQAAKKRINQYTTTAGISYELLHTELAILADKNSHSIAFRDYQLHEVLINSGIKRHVFDKKNNRNEWFYTDLETVKKSINALKEGRKQLNQSEKTIDKSPVIFRPEQKEAIEKTITQFKNSNKMLWNAKMRFGKTLSALEVAKREKFKKTIIFTHRPVVIDGWHKDFSKIFYDTEDDYIFGSKHNSKGISLEDLNKTGKKYVYFTSAQDLTGSSLVGGNYDKNELIFNTQWDYIIIDEAHEGTQTALGEAVIKALKSNDSKVLELSGTPFNRLEDFEEKQIYTWDYVMEQKAKNDWYTTHFCDSNPYEELPELNIYTYYLNKLISGYEDIEDKAFNFREFFRTWTGDIKVDRKHVPDGVRIGEFMHRDDVWSFLNLITKTDDSSNYPFSTQEYQDFFRHSLWMLPGVKEAKALSALMRVHPVFGSGVFEIVNVAGEGDEEKDSKDALDAVRKAIGDKSEDNYTITLSCGRLTTGVSVPEWTAVLMLSGTYSTSATSYLQTIFRVQTPANIGGKIKEKCYVFDFAPDRTLKMVAEASKISAKAGKTTNNDRQIIGDFLNFCPVISIDGTYMKAYDVDIMLQQLKRAYTDKVVRNGFDDNHIYNDELLKLNDIELKEFDSLKKIVGASKQTKKTGDIDINNQGLTNEEYEKLEKINKKPKIELTDDEKALIEEVKNKRTQRDNAISILRAISIRIPLLIYGADIPYEEEITIKNFAGLIDDLSWVEFMPNNVTKKIFTKFSRYYDDDIFAAASRQIRNTAKSADILSITERIKKIASLFATFKNPDKETVLTPWRVVNMHLGDCLGGYRFFDDKNIDIVDEPYFIDQGEVTEKTLANPNARILELNSKTGLYPLYVAYSIFRKKCETYDDNQLDAELEIKLWNETVVENIFIVCKTKMAMSITRRTLVGYSNAKVNTRHFEDLINQITHKSDNFLRKIPDGKTYWKINNDTDMKFNAIVGNPPYQVMDGGNSASAIPVYNKFIDIAKKINPNYISMIMPARWFAGGRGLDKFRADMLNDRRIKTLVDFPNGKDCFPTTFIAGGICYLLWDNKYNGECLVSNIRNKVVKTTKRYLNEFDVFIRMNEAISILYKVLDKKETELVSIVSPQRPYGFRTYERGVETSFKGAIKLYSSKGIGYVAESEVSAMKHNIYKYKVILSRADSGHPQEEVSKGTTTNVICKGKVLSPSEICTETWLSIGAFNTMAEASNLNEYLKTKFVRFLLLQALSSIMITNTMFKFVPLQDFNKEWTDEKLYKKYGLTEDEIAFIESMIKPMQ